MTGLCKVCIASYPVRSFNFSVRYMWTKLDIHVQTAKDRSNELPDSDNTHDMC